MSRPTQAPNSVDPLFAVSGGGGGARPNSPEFAVGISILAKIHSDGIFFQRRAISQAICLLPQGLLSIEHILWSQQEITSNSVLRVCVPP